MNKETLEKKHQTEIFEYIRRRMGGKTVKVGIILGKVSPDHGTIKIGWSKCNVKLDQFDVDEGLRLAENRCEKPSEKGVPNCVQKQYRRFCSRAVRYFKNAHTMVMDKSV